MTSSTVSSRAVARWAVLLLPALVVVLLLSTETVKALPIPVKEGSSNSKNEDKKQPKKKNLVVGDSPSVAWTFPTYVPIYSTPIFWQNLVIFGSTDTNVYALNQATGARVWTFATNDRIESSPCLSEEYGILFIGSTDKYFYALNATTGSKIWRYGTTHKNGVSTCFYRKDYVYWTTHKGHIHQAHALTGAEGFFPQNARGSPFVSDDGKRVFVGQVTGYVSAFATDTGLTLWLYSASGTNDFGPVTVRYGQVFTCMNTGHIWALDTTTGDKNWKTNLGSFTGYDDTLQVNTPAAELGLVLIGTKAGTLYALNEASGDGAWTHQTSTSSLSSPAAIGGKTYIGGNDGGLRIFDTSTASLLHTFNADGPILPGHRAAIADGFVYFGTQNGTFYCLSYTGAGPTPSPPTYLTPVPPPTPLPWTPVPTNIGPTVAPWTNQPPPPPVGGKIVITTCLNTSCINCRPRSYISGHCEQTSATTSIYRFCSADGNTLYVNTFVKSSICAFGSAHRKAEYARLTCYDDEAGSFVLTQCRA